MEALTQFLPLIFLFAIFYFLIIRPQQKQQKEHKNMMGNLKKGDRILTTGGLYVKIIKIKDDEEVIKVQLNENTIIKIDKSYIARKIEISESNKEDKVPNLLKKS